MALSKFVTEEYSYDKEYITYYLTENDQTIDTPPGLKTELYPHQKTIVRAMLDAEKKRWRKIPSYLNRMSIEPMIVESNAIVLSEPLGSGKTFEIIAFLLSRQLPSAYPEYDNNLVMHTRINSDRYHMLSKGHAVCYTEIVRKFERLNRPALLVVGRSVLVQWRETLKTYTDMKIFEIGNYYDLCKFYDMFKTRGHNIYDLILVKNDKVTGNFTLDGEIQTTAERSIVTVLSKMSKIDKSCWSTVIYDDFDVINISSCTNYIHSLFTIYVSATKKYAAEHKISMQKFNSIEDCVEAMPMLLTKAFKDNDLFSIFNVKNDPAFTDKSTQIPIIKGYKYVFQNPDDKFIDLVGMLGVGDIAEMLNGDAIHTAAETLGIKADTVSTIFEKLLDQKYNEYIKLSKLADHIERFQKYMKTLDYPDDDVKTRISVYQVIEQLKKCNAVELEYYSDELWGEVNLLHVEVVRGRDELGKAVERVKSNIKDGDCPVCCLPLAEMEAFILKCCGIVLCVDCGVRSTQLQKRRDWNNNSDQIMGKCPKCSRPVNLRTDCVFLDKGFDADKLLNARGDEDDHVVQPVAQAPVVVPDPDEPEIKNPKLKALLEIINGKVPEGRTEYTPNITKLLNGRVDKPQTDKTVKKVLIFANFDETLDLIKSFLTEHKINYLHLQGTATQMHNIVQTWQNKGTVLLINSSHHCAGLNLQCVTDMVFFHKIIDANIEGQVAGRGQRIGRTCNLHIHSLLYNNEAR